MVKEKSEEILISEFFVLDISWYFDYKKFFPIMSIIEPIVIIAYGITKYK